MIAQSFVLSAGQAVPWRFLLESSLSLSLYLFIFLSLWLSHNLGCYLMLAPSDCPQGIRAIPYPKHATHTSLFSPPAGFWQTQASGLLLHWELRLGAYSVGSFLFPPGYIAL